MKNLRLHNSAKKRNKVGAVKIKTRKSRNSGNETRVLEFGNINPKTELLHAITINDKEKRIAVVFCGTISWQEILADAKCRLCEGRSESESLFLCLQFGNDLTQYFVFNNTQVKSPAEKEHQIGICRGEFL